jgi:hypothetical protein
MALPRLGSCFCENRAIAGFDCCCFSCSLFFKGLLGGKGTGEALFAAAAPVSATDKAVTTATLLYMPFALAAERLVAIVKGHMIRSAINRMTIHSVSIFHGRYCSRAFENICDGMPSDNTSGSNCCRRCSIRDISARTLTLNDRFWR